MAHNDADDEDVGAASGREIERTHDDGALRFGRVFSPFPDGGSNTAAGTIPTPSKRLRFGGVGTLRPVRTAAADAVHSRTSIFESDAPQLGASEIDADRDVTAC